MYAYHRGVQVAQGSLQQLGRVGRHDLLAHFREVDALEAAQLVRAPDCRAEPGITQQVVVDALTTNPAGRGHGVVLTRIEQIDVISLLQVVQGKGRAGQELVQEPQPPGVFPGGLGTEVGLELVPWNHAEQACEDREVRAVVLEREFEMIAEAFPRPVPGRVDLLDCTSGRIDAVDCSGRYQGRVPIRNDPERVPLDECRIAGGPQGRLFLVFSSHGVLQKNRYADGIIVTAGQSSRKAITDVGAPAQPVSPVHHHALGREEKRSEHRR